MASANEILCDTFNNVSVITSKQHVYLYPLNKRVKFQFEAKPFPKKDKEVAVVSRKVLKDEKGTYLPKGVVTKYTDEVLVSVF